MDITDKRVEMAWDEYKILSDNIIKFDNILFIVKSWSITTFGAVLTIYFSKTTCSNPKILLILAACLSILYWSVDYMYKRFQSYQIARSRLLNYFLNNLQEFKDYRVPDLFFQNIYLSKDEQETLKRQGFIPIGNSMYSQRPFRLELFLRPQTSMLYLAQIAAVALLAIV